MTQPKSDTTKGGDGTVPLHEGLGLAATSQFDSGTRHQSQTTTPDKKKIIREALMSFITYLGATEGVNIDADLAKAQAALEALREI